MSWPGTVLQRWGSDRLSQHKPDNNITTFYLTEVFQLDNKTTTWEPFTYFYRHKYSRFFSHQISRRHVFLQCISASYQMYGVKSWADVPLSFHDDNPVTKGRSLWTLKWGLSRCLVLIHHVPWWVMIVPHKLGFDFDLHVPWVMIYHLVPSRSTRWWLVWLITSKYHLLLPYSTRIHFLCIHTVSCLSDSFLK